MMCGHGGGGRGKRGRGKRFDADMHDRAGNVTWYGDNTTCNKRGQHRMHRAYVLLQGSEDPRVSAKDVDPFRGGDREEGGHGCGEDERGAVDPLVVNNYLGASAETTGRSEAVGNRAH